MLLFSIYLKYFSLNFFSLCRIFENTYFWIVTSFLLIRKKDKKQKKSYQPKTTYLVHYNNIVS